MFKTEVVEYRTGNFKAIGKEITIPVKPITLIFGKNGSGKSTLLESIYAPIKYFRYADSQDKAFCLGDVSWASYAKKEWVPTSSVELHCEYYEATDVLPSGLLETPSGVVEERANYQDRMHYEVACDFISERALLPNVPKSPIFNARVALKAVSLYASVFHSIIKYECDGVDFLQFNQYAKKKDSASYISSLMRITNKIIYYLGYINEDAGAYVKLEALLKDFYIPNSLSHKVFFYKDGLMCTGILSDKDKSELLGISKEGFYTQAVEELVKKSRSGNNEILISAAKMMRDKADAFGRVTLSDIYINPNGIELFDSMQGAFPHLEEKKQLYKDSHAPALERIYDVLDPTLPFVDITPWELLNDALRKDDIVLSAVIANHIALGFISNIYERVINAALNRMLHIGPLRDRPSININDDTSNSVALFSNSGKYLWRSLLHNSTILWMVNDWLGKPDGINSSLKFKRRLYASFPTETLMFKIVDLAKRLRISLEKYMEVEINNESKYDLKYKWGLYYDICNYTITQPFNYKIAVDCYAEDVELMHNNEKIVEHELSGYGKFARYVIYYVEQALAWYLKYELLPKYAKQHITANEKLIKEDLLCIDYYDLILEAISSKDFSSFDQHFRWQENEISRIKIRYELELVDERIGKVVTLSHVGSGYSQIIPILIALIMPDLRFLNFLSTQDFYTQTILIEQPELHIHPGMQAALADLFVEAINWQVPANNYIIETHSEHFILRLLRRIRGEEGPKLDPKDLSIIYCKMGENGVEVTPITVDENGDFSVPWPDGFFPERLEDL